MQFIYHPEAKTPSIKIEGELYNYIFKVRRHSSSDDIYLRNLNDKNIYKYQIVNIDRRKAMLKLQSYEEKIIEPKKKLHIGWCIIDPKSVEKYIASLNEIGVTKITFIYCQYSQRKYKQNFQKLEKLLINSSSQCGRSSIVQLDTCDNIDKFLKDHPDSYIFNFSQNSIKKSVDDINTVILGSEGGFSLDEIEKFADEKIVGIDSNIILRSETAAISLASHILQ